MKAYVQMLIHNLDNEVQNPEDRKRVLKRLAEIEGYANSIRDDLWMLSSDEVAEDEVPTRTSFATDESDL
jgi:hypothetical protein